MSIKILYTDLRTVPSKLEKCVVEWQPDLTALQVLEKALGETLTNEVERGLKSNSREIIVSWYNESTGDVSEIGGVGTLEWHIPDDTVLTISYENEATTQQQVDESIKWTLEQEL